MWFWFGSVAGMLIAISIPLYIGGLSIVASFFLGMGATIMGGLIGRIADQTR